MLLVQPVFKSVIFTYIFEIGMLLVVLLKKKSSFPGDFQRPASEQKELLNKWNEMGTDEPGKIN